MTVSNPYLTEIQDEGIDKGYATRINFTGSGVSTTVSSGVATVTVSSGGGGSFTLDTVEKDLGALPRRSGTFDITGLNGLTTDRPVLIQQASGPYTGKGTLADEAEMDQVSVTASVLDPSTIRAYWNSPTFVVGSFKFHYAVG